MMIRIRLVLLVPLFSMMFAVGLSGTAYPQATLTVENAEDATGKCTTVDVSLSSPDDVRGVQLEICDTGNHLVALGCKPAARVPAGYTCNTNELENGCASIILFPSSENIPPGTGPLLTVTYGLFWDAPVTDIPYTPEDDTFSSLVAGGVRVADANGDPLPSVDVVSGSFHFIPGCSTDADCPDDEVFCNGIEVCQSGQCVTTESCPPGLYCDEALDVCRGTCSSNQECDDGLFCNGVETCQYVASLDAFFCTPGVASCAPPAPLCDESTDTCVECLDNDTCDDNVFCNGTEVCVAGFCQPGAPSCPPLSTCDEANGVCLCSTDADCDDGLFCNGTETCSSFTGICDIAFNYNTEYPCLDCMPNLDDCDCNEANDSCQPGSLTVGSGAGLPGSIDNLVTINLDTLFVDVGALQMDVCDPDALLSCSGCEVAGRTPGAFSCAAVEQPDGCCRVALLDLSFSGAFIEPGSGPVLTIHYTVDSAVPAGQCRLLDPRNILVANGAALLPLAVDVIPGNFCFSAAGQASFAASSSERRSSANGVPASQSPDSGNQAGDEMDYSLGMDLWKKLFESGASDGRLFPFTLSETCPLAATLDDPQALAALREFRDKVLSRDISGIIFTFLFYRNAAELTGLLEQHEELAEQVRIMVDEYTPLISEVNNGGKVFLGENDKARIIGLLDEFKGKGSQQLKGDISLLIEELRAGNVEELFGFTAE